MGNEYADGYTKTEVEWQLVTMKICAANWIVLHVILMKWVTK